MLGCLTGSTCHRVGFEVARPTNLILSMRHPAGISASGFCQVSRMICQQSPGCPLYALCQVAEEHGAHVQVCSRCYEDGEGS